MNRGRFITLEGGEGVGKSTQARLLAETLKARGIEVLLTREPGGSEGAEAIRGLLLAGGADRWSLAAEALLFAAARADHVGRTIRPALAAGRWVICDRFLDSSRAYQAAVGDDDVMTLHRIGSDGLLPDRTLLLRLDGSAARARALARDAGASDRIGGKPPDYHAAVAAAFDRFAAAEPDRFRIIDAEGMVETVQSRLLDALADVLP